MSVTWDTLCSGIVCAASALVIYFKQRNDQLIETLQVKLSESLAVVSKVKQAHLYLKNEANHAYYTYECILFIELDNLSNYLDLLLSDCELKEQILSHIEKMKKYLTNALEIWHTKFRTDHFERRKKFFSTLTPGVATKVLKDYLDQDIHAFKLQLASKNNDLINLEKDLKVLFKAYINEKQLSFNHIVKLNGIIF